MIISAMARVHASSRWVVGLVTLVVWAAAAGAVVYWALRLSTSAAAASDPAAAVETSGLPTANSQQVARALGASASAPVQQATADILKRVKLEGVLTDGGGGAALIAIDGKLAQPVRVGGTLQGLDGGWTLRSVDPHSAVVAQDGREARLELPPMDQRSQAGDAVAPAAAAPLGAARVPGNRPDARLLARPGSPKT